MSTDVNAAVHPLTRFRKFMEDQFAEIAKQLPPDIDPVRFVRTILTTVGMNQELLEADRTSLMGACMSAAKDGLLPDGREATIQVYNTKAGKDSQGRDIYVKKAQYMPMVRGIINAMYNTGGIMMVDAVAVYEKDQFSYERGDTPRIGHSPYIGDGDAGKVIAAYCIVTLSNGEKKREVMIRHEIEKVREASKAKNGSGWTTWYDQFAIKAVIKRTAKQLPTSSERLLRVIDADNEAMGFEFGSKTTEAGNLYQAGNGEAGKPNRLAAIIGDQLEPVPMPQFMDTQPENVPVNNEGDSHG